MIRHRYRESVTNRAKGLVTGCYFVSVLPNLLIADNPRVKSSESQVSKIWRSVVGSEEYFEAHNEGESEVERRLESNAKRKMESKIQACVEYHEGGVYDINAGPPRITQTPLHLHNPSSETPPHQPLPHLRQ